MGILLAYRRVWCYSQRQGATGRNQCSSLGFLYSQGRQKNCKRNGEALNFSIQLWNAPWRSICMTDPGEALLPRPRLVCVNSWFFRWWPVYALETLQQKEGLVLFKEPQSDRGLKQHSCQGTKAQSVAMVGEWSQKVKECVQHFVISQAGSTSSTFPVHVQGLLMLLLPADNLHNQQ